MFNSIEPALAILRQEIEGENAKAKIKDFYGFDDRQTSHIIAVALYKLRSEIENDLSCEHQTLLQNVEETITSSCLNSAVS